MDSDDLMAALERLLEPDGRDVAADGSVVPYWAMRPDDGAGADAGTFGPDMAAFLSDGLADPTATPEPSLADIAAYVDGMLSGEDLARFEAALVASPELRADTDMVSQHVSRARADADLHRDAAPSDGT